MGLNATGTTGLCTIMRQSRLHKRSPRRLSSLYVLVELSISLNDRIDDITTLHAAGNRAIKLTGAIEQIRTEVLHQESAASPTDRLSRIGWQMVPALILSRFFVQSS